MNKDLEDHIREVRKILEDIPEPNISDEMIGQAIDYLIILEDDARKILQVVNR